MARAYAPVRSMVAVAIKAALSETWGQKEAEALRRMIAGDLPVPAEEWVDERRAKVVAKKMVMAIKHLQGVVATSRMMWTKASATERAHCKHASQSRN